jgi:hypothetical protein
MTRFIGLFDTARDYILQLIITRILVSTVTSSLPLLGSGFQLRAMTFLWVPKRSPASAVSVWQQELTRTETQRFFKRNSGQVKIKVTVRLTVSQSVSRADIYYCLTVTVLFLWDALSDEKTGLSFVYAAGACQRSLSRVRVLGTRYHIILSQIWDFLFRRLLRLAGSRWRYSTPPPHGLKCNS